MRQRGSGEAHVACLFLCRPASPSLPSAPPPTHPFSSSHASSTLSHSRPLDNNMRPSSPPPPPFSAAPSAPHLPAAAKVPEPTAAPTANGPGEEVPPTNDGAETVEGKGTALPKKLGGGGGGGGGKGSGGGVENSNANGGGGGGGGGKKGKGKNKGKAGKGGAVATANL